MQSVFIPSSLSWLESCHLKLEGMNTDGIGHRYVSSTFQGPGRVVFDVLAPDNVGERADLTTSPPARTVSAPGIRKKALASARRALIRSAISTQSLYCSRIVA